MLQIIRKGFCKLVQFISRFLGMHWPKSYQRIKFSCHLQSKHSLVLKASKGCKIFLSKNFQDCVLLSCICEISVDAKAMIDLEIQWLSTSRNMV